MKSTAETETESVREKGKEQGPPKEFEKGKQRNKRKGGVTGDFTTSSSDTPAVQIAMLRMERAKDHRLRARTRIKSAELDLVLLLRCVLWLGIGYQNS